MKKYVTPQLKVRELHLQKMLAGSDNKASTNTATITTSDQSTGFASFDE